ncbi:MAG: GNAT family N-acetyltransferase, partial [Luteolibacter sp.]
KGESDAGPCILDVQPLDPVRHSAELFVASCAPGAEDRFRYLPEQPPANLADFNRWLEKASSETDPLFYAVIDKDSGHAEGLQALMHIDTANGVVEIGR